MATCYLCGEQMIAKAYHSNNRSLFTTLPKFEHNEHIIQNALHGRLKSDKILCENCGSILNKKIDTDFTNLFSGFTSQLQEVLVTRDRIRKSAALDGYFFVEGDDPIEISYKDSSVTPKIPFYSIDDNERRIYIYANKKRGTQFKPIVLKDLQRQGVDVNQFSIEYITDIRDKGILGLNFSQGVVDFNEKFHKGLNKIAVGFAYLNGIERDKMPRSLDTRKQEVVYSRNVIPFVPIGTFDKYVELHRPLIERTYPTHTLILFTQNQGNHTKTLYCYIDLFSTFQYYVILNDNYRGKDIYAQYNQALPKQEKPKINVRRIKPKFLNLLVEQFDIDTDQYKGETFEEYCAFLQSEYDKITLSYDFELNDELKIMIDLLKQAFAFSHLEGYNPNSDKKKVLIDSFKDESEIGRITLYNELEQHLNFIIEENRSIFRTDFLEADGHGGLEWLSTPHECAMELKKNDQIFKAYGYLKFGQLSNFVFESTETT